LARLDLPVAVRLPSGQDPVVSV